MPTPNGGRRRDQRRRDDHWTNRDRKLVILTFTGLLVVGSLISWIFVLVDAPATVETSTVETSTVADMPTTRLDGKDPSARPERPVTVVFGGDVAFERAARSNLDTDPTSVVGPAARVLSAADLAIVNLETAITDGGTPADKTYLFRAPPVALDALAAAGVDVASMANNHGLDYGPEGLADSLVAERSHDVPIIGIGEDERSAYAPFVAEIAGTTIGIVAATQVIDDNLVDSWTATPGHGGVASAKRVERLAQAVRETAANTDFTIAFLHWGTEGEFCPNAAQRSIVEPLVAAGADAIIGGHAHRVQGFGMSGDAFVAFGLGNFVFRAQSPEARESGLMRLTVEGDQLVSSEWLPARINSSNQPVPLEGQAADTALATVESRQSCTGLSPATN